MQLETMVKIGVAISGLCLVNRGYIRPKSKFKRYNYLSLQAEHFLGHFAFGLCSSVINDLSGISSGENGGYEIAVLNFLFGIYWDGVREVMNKRKPQYDQIISDVVGSIAIIPFY